MDVSRRRLRENYRHHPDDLAYRPGGHYAYCGGQRRDFLPGVQRHAAVAGIHLAVCAPDPCRKHLRWDLYFRVIKPCSDP